ncbi:MAG: hypothetical protein ACE5KW_01205 [Dehalococcoidia bacterium]
MLEGAAPRLATVKQIARPVLTAAALQQLTAALLAAVLLEVVLLRLATRVGVHLPKEGAVNSAFHAASLLGSLAFNFASLLAIVVVALLLGSMALRLGNSLGRLTLAALSLAMLSGLGLSLATGAPAADALFGLAATLLVGLIGLVLVRQGETPPAARLALALIVAAYFCYQYYVLGHLFYRLLDYSALPPLSIAVLRLGEGLVLAAGGAVFWAWGAGRWRKVGTAGLAAVGALLLVLALAALSPVSTISILALWTTGLSLFLPIPVYLLSLGLYLLTLVACWRSGDARWTAAGLLLLLVAGYMPEATYQHLLLLLGVAFLSPAVRWAVAE